MFTILRTAILALFLSGALIAVSPIELSTRSTMSRAPGYFRLRITVPRQDTNRRICLQVQQIQNGSYYQNSCWDHVGSQAPLTTWKDIKELNAGRYLVAAALLTSDDVWHTSSPITLSVIGFEFESEPEV